MSKPTIDGTESCMYFEKNPFKFQIEFLYGFFGSKTPLQSLM